jgi:hypothetical protein
LQTVSALLKLEFEQEEAVVRWLWPAKLSSREKIEKKASKTIRSPRD